MWKPIVEITILWFVIYHVMIFFEGTRAMQALRGIIILTAAFFLFQKLDLEVLNWLMSKLFTISILAILIIFHPEIRQGLARLGQRYLFSTASKEDELDQILKEVDKATDDLVKSSVGALIAIEKIDPLNAYTASGVILDARVSADLLESIFTPRNPLHDGAVVIQRGRILAAGCVLPLTENPDLSRVFGTRHRAALGLSEETDAILVIVSEERQDISFVYKRRLYRDLNKKEMFAKIKEFLKNKDA
jgi:diadenylate cyclase